MFSRFWRFMAPHTIKCMVPGKGRAIKRAGREADQSISRPEVRAERLLA